MNKLKELQELVELLKKNNDVLMQQVAFQSTQLEQANNQNEQSTKQVECLQQEITYLRELLSEMNHKMFGKSKESLPESNG